MNTQVIRHEGQELECMFLPLHPACTCQYLELNLPGCTGTSLVSFCSGAIPSGRQESGTAGAECYEENHGKVRSLDCYSL